MKIKFDLILMKYISLFNSLTGASVKDVFEEKNKLVFVVEKGQIAKAVGKKGANVKKISSLLKKNIKIVEFSSDVSQFVKNYVYPVKPEEVVEEEGVVSIKGSSTSDKSILIGRNAANLEQLKKVVSRYFKVEEIKVV